MYHSAAPSFTAEPCLGREDELRRLCEIHDASHTHGALVLINGPSGVGKSTFLREAELRFLARGSTVLPLRCRAGAASMAPMVDLVERLRTLACSWTGRPELGATVEALLERFSGRSPAGSNRIELFESLAGLLANASKLSGRLVLSIHDLDRADPATLEGVGYLARALASVPELVPQPFCGLLLATSSQTGDRLQQSSWCVGVHLHTLELAGLDDAGVRAFLSAPQVVERIRELTDGHPERLEALASGRPSPTTAPAEGEARASYPADQRQMLWVLSVVARPISAQALRELLDVTPAAMACAANELVTQGIVEKSIVDGEIRLAFRQAGHEKRTYESIPDESRRALHLRFAEQLLDSPHPPRETIAIHLLRARAGQQAVAAARLAGPELELAHCPERAADLYQQALIQCARPRERQELREALCAIYERTSRYDRAIDVATRLAAENPRPSSADTLRLGRLHLLRGDTQEAISMLNSLQQGDENQPTQAAALALLAEARMMTGEGDVAANTAREAVSMLESAPSTTCDTMPGMLTRIRAQNTLARVLLEQDHTQEAVEHASHNLRIARQLSLPAEEVRARIQMGLAEMRSGQLEKSQAHYEKARQLADSRGDRRALGACLQHLGVLAERQRDYRQALTRYQDAINHWKCVGHRGYLAWVALDVSKLYLDLGDLGHAEAMLRLSQELKTETPPLPTQVNMELLFGRIAELQSRRADAEEHFRRALRIAETTNQRERRARTLLHLATLFEQRGDYQRAGLELGRLSTDPTLPRIEVRRLHLRATIDLALGDKAACEGHLERAFAIHHGMCDPETEWMLHLLRAQLAAKREQRRASFLALQLAARVFDKLLSMIPEDLQGFYRETPLAAQLLRLRNTNETDSKGGANSGLPTVVATSPTKPTRVSPRIIGAHPRIVQLLHQAGRVAESEATVLIRGESGTGKELVANALHQGSQRAEAPLVKMNCAALAEGLLLSELFGHERGSFTGASQRKRGRFELAHGGTIFLDEIGDIPAKTQVALLRVLQERTFERVGGTESIEVDVRVICATHRNLEEMVSSGHFREDLYYRLRGVQLEVPALRDRASDIPLLADHILEKIAKESAIPRKALEPSAVELLSRHSWPGNIRELENVLRSVALFSEHRQLRTPDFADFPELLQSPAGTGAPTTATNAYQHLRTQNVSLRDFKKQVEQSCIAAALADAKGNISQAAKLLGMKRPRLSQLIKEHGLGVSR